MAKDNKSLGRFILDGIPPAPRGMPQVEVAFDIDANGILTVSAKDKATSKEQKITISGSSRLEKDEIERMKKEAEQFAESDRKLKELIDLRNQAEQVIYAAEKSLKDLGDKVDAATKTEVEEKVRKIKEGKDGNDAGALKKAMDDLQPALSKIGEQMYKKAQEEQKGKEQNGGEPSKDEGSQPKDADFEEKK